MASAIISFIISTAIGAVQARAAKKKAAAARDASLGQDVRSSNSAEPIDIHYGETATNGIRVSANVRGSITEQSVNNLPSGSQIPRTEDAREGKRNEFLGTQHVIGAGDLSDVRDMWTDDQKPSSEFIRASSLAQWDVGLTGVSPVGNASDFGRGGNNTFTGLSYATNVWKLNREDPQFSGAPTPTYFVRGNKVFDPRVPGHDQTDRSTWEYSNNIALVLLDYLTHPDYGLGWDYATDIDPAAFIKAADICGQIVQSDDVTDLIDTFGDVDPPDVMDNPYPFPEDFPVEDGEIDYQTALGNFNFFGGNSYISGFNNSLNTASVFGDRTQVLRHEFNGSLSTGASHRDNLGTILALVEGAEFFRSPTGLWKFVVPNSIDTEDDQSVAIIDESELIGNISISYPDASTKLNQIDMRFSNTNKDFADDTLTFPAKGSRFYEQLLDSDNGVLLRNLLDLRGLSDKYHSNSIAANKIAVSRKESYTFRTRPSGFLLEPGDVVMLNDPLAGINMIPVRIVTTKVMTTLDVQFDAVRFDKDDYAWRLINLELIENRDDILATINPPVMLDPMFIEAERVMAVSWTDVDNDATVNGYIVEVFVTGEADWTTIGTTLENPKMILHKPGDDMGTYKYRVRSITSDSRQSLVSNESVEVMIQATASGTTFGVLVESKTPAAIGTDPSGWNDASTIFRNGNNIVVKAMVATLTENGSELPLIDHTGYTYLWRKNGLSTFTLSETQRADSGLTSRVLLLNGDDVADRGDDAFTCEITF